MRVGLSNGAMPRLGTGVLRSFPPPPSSHYIPASAIESAWQASENPFHGKRSRHSGAQKAGLAYQKRIVALLGEELCAARGWRTLPGPWYCYRTADDRLRYCQPDLLLLNDEEHKGIIVEIKVRWTSDAWWQLRRLYLPVLQCAMQGWSFLPLTICRSYDPAICIEERVALVDHPLALTNNHFNVLVMR